MTPASLRPLAEADLVERARYYRVAGGADLGERFFASAVAALKAAERMPRAGSPIGDRYEIPGLRVRRITGFPCSWYYFVHDDHLDVVRLLADPQDIATTITD